MHFFSAMSPIPFILVLFDRLFVIFLAFTDSHIYHTLVQQVGRQEPSAVTVALEVLQFVNHKMTSSTSMRALVAACHAHCETRRPVPGSKRSVVFAWSCS